MSLLKAFAQHLPRCAKSVAGGFDAKCSCGFDLALQRDAAETATLRRSGRALKEVARCTRCPTCREAAEGLTIRDAQLIEG